MRLNEKQLRRLLAISIALVVFCVFARVLGADFVQWDDDINIYQNPHIQGLNLERVVWMFTDREQVRYYAPLSWLTLALIHAVFGLKPVGYHLVNLLLHCGNAVLLFLLIERVIGMWRDFKAARLDKVSDEVDDKVRDEGWRVLLASALAALFWALHPLRVEPVAWATGLSNCLALSFCLMSALCFLKARREEIGSDASRNRHHALGIPHHVSTRWYWGSVVSYAISLLCYPIGLGLPLIFFFLEMYLRKEGRFSTEGNEGNEGREGARVTRPSKKEVFLQKVAKTGKGSSTEGNGGDSKELGSGSPFRSAVLRALPYALPAMAVLALSVYRRVEAVGIWSAPVELERFGWEARIAQGFYIWAYYLWKPWFPVNLSPVYTTLVWFDATDWPFILSVVTIVTVTALLVYERRVWPGIWVLWLSYLILLVPLQGWFEHPHYAADRYSLMPHVPLAIAVAHSLWRGLQKWWLLVVVTSVAALVCLGAIAVRQVRVWNDSGTLFEHMLSQLGASRYRADISYRLGRWKQGRGETGAAVEHYREALELYPTFVDAHVRCGAALSEEGHIAEAVKHYLAALRSDPDHILALNNLAWLHATQPDAQFRGGAEAVRMAERACELTGYKEPMLMGTLAAAYAEAGRFEDAVAMAEKAAALAREQGNVELAKTNEELREIYRKREAYREHGN